MCRRRTRRAAGSRTRPGGARRRCRPLPVEVDLRAVAHRRAAARARRRSCADSFSAKFSACAEGGALVDRADLAVEVRVEEADDRRVQLDVRRSCARRRPARRSCAIGLPIRAGGSTSSRGRRARRPGPSVCARPPIRSRPSSTHVVDAGVAQRVGDRQPGPAGADDDHPLRDRRPARAGTASCRRRSSPWAPRTPSAPAARPAPRRRRPPPRAAGAPAACARPVHPPPPDRTRPGNLRHQLPAAAVSAAVGVPAQRFQRSRGELSWPQQRSEDLGPAPQLSLDPPLKTRGARVQGFDSLSRFPIGGPV